MTDNDTSNLTVGSAAYRAALRRYNELVRAGPRGLTLEELAEMETLAAALDAAELRASRPIAALVDDYEFAVGQAGSLGGVELV